MVAGAVPVNGISAEALSLQNRQKLDNGYISVTVSDKNGGFGIRTTEGDKVNKSDNDQYLLFEYDEDNTSFTSFQVTRNGQTKEYIFGGVYPGSSKVSVTSGDNTISAVWSVDDLTFTQDLRLVSTGSNEHGTVLISYSVKNNGAPAEVKCRILMDTALGYQDYAYYKIDSGYIERETELGKNGYEKSFYAVTSPESPRIVAYTINATIDERECVPYKTVFAHWNNLASTVFDYTADETMTFTNFSNKKYLTSDSAYALYFDMGTVQTNGNAVAATNYGVYSNESMDDTAKFAVNINAPDVIEYAKNPDGSENRSAYVDDGNFEVKTHVKNISGKDYSKVRIVVTAAGCIEPLDQLGNPTNSDLNNPYSIEISDFTAGKQLDINWKFHAVPQEVGQYGRLQFKVYDVSDDATQNSGQLLLENLLGEGFSYIMCPGSVSKMPVLKFTASSPDTLYTSGIRNFNLVGENFSTLLDKSAYSLRVSRMDGQKINGKASFVIPAEQFQIDDSKNVISVIFNEENPGTLPEGMYAITLDYVDASKPDISGPALQFHVSNEEKYKNESYGFLAVAKDGLGETEYKIHRFMSEDEYWSWLEVNGGLNRSDILLEFQGNFILQKTEDGSVAYKGVSNNKTHNVMTLNGCLDIRNGTCTVAEKDGSVTVDFDADIYTTGSGTYVHKGVAALTELEKGSQYGLIQYDENGDREGVSGETIALIWPSAGEAFQNLMGLLFNLKYCELGTIAHEGAPSAKGSETRLAAFGAAMDLSFLIPGSVEKQYIIDRTGATEDALGSSYDAAEHNKISFSADELRALNKQADYRNMTANTDATQEDIDAGRFSDMTVDDTPGYNALSIVVDDILFGGEYLGVNLEVGLGLPPYIANFPALECVLSVHTVGDWSFSAEGQCHFLNFKLQANLAILSHDGVPIVDSMSFFVGGFAPGINVDGVGILWLQGVQGGIENIYDTIFLTDKIPPLKLVLGAQFSILQIFNAYASMGISLRGLDVNLTNGQFNEYTDESTGQVTVPQPITMEGSVMFYWYPEFYFHAAVSLSLAQCIWGSGYIVAEESGFYEFFIRGSLNIPPDIPIIGGYEVAGIGMGVNTDKLWGKINYLSSIDIGVTYYWGGDIDWSGSAATPTYPELLGGAASASYMLVPMGYDEEVGDTLYMSFGNNLRLSAASAGFAGRETKAINDMIVSDVVNGSNHTMKLEQNGSGKILLISWASEDEETAREKAEEIVIADNSDPSKTIGIKLWRKDAPEGANANFSYDEETKTAYLSVVFAADDADVYGKTWDITTMPSALLVVYDVLPLPEFAIDSASVNSNEVKLVFSGSQQERFTKLSVVAEGKDHGQIHLLGNVTAPFANGANTLTLALPENAISDTYTIRVTGTDDDNQIYHEAEASVAYVNPNQPAAPSAVSAKNAGDYKVAVSAAVQGDYDGYQFTAYDSKGAVVNGMSGILLHKDGTTVTYDGEGKIINALTDDTAEQYIIGGQFSQTGKDAEGNPTTFLAGFAAGDYTVEVRSWKKLPSGALLLSSPAETRITVREPKASAITVQASAANGKAPITETLLPGTKDEHTITVLADSTVKLTLSASDAVSGTWRIDGGFREDLRGEITNAAARTTLTVSGLEDGQHQLTFLGTNSQGDTVSTTFSFVVDTLGPRLLLAEPVNGGLFDYLTGELTISGVTDKNVSMTVEDRTTGHTVLQKTALRTNNDGAFETIVTLDRTILSHELTITLSDAVGNTTQKDVSVMSNGLGSIEKLMICADGTDVTNTKQYGPGPYNYQVLAKLKGAKDLYVLLNDERMISLECAVAEGSVDQDNAGTELTLTVQPNAEGLVTARFHVNDSGAYSVSTAFANPVEKIGALTISGELDVTYGTPVPEVTVVTHGSDGEVTVYYYTDEACATGETTTVPTEAGTYWVKAKMTAGTNYSAAVSNVLSFTISRASIAPTVTLDGWTYGESAARPSVSGNSGNAEVSYLYKVKGAADSTYTDVVPADAGDYTVKAVVDQSANYSEGSATADFTIAAKDISSATIDAIPDQPYTGKPIEPKPGVKDGEKSLITDTDFTFSYENNLTAGSQAVVKVTGQGNYTGEASASFQVIKADLPAATVNINGWAFGNGPSTPSVEGNLENGDVTFHYKAKDADDNTYTTQVPFEIGAYTVRATIEATANYNGTSVTADFEISEKLPQIIKAENVTAAYGDTDKYVSGSTNGNGTIGYTVKSGSDVVEVDPVTGKLTFKKAGPAVITVTASETDTHAKASKDIVVTVDRQKIQIPAADTTVYTYTSSELTYQIPASDAYTVDGNRQTAANEAGYTVTVKLADTEKYQWSDGSSLDRTYTFVIHKAIVNAPAGDSTVFTYNGKEQTYVIAESDAYTVSGNRQTAANEEGHVVTVELSDKDNYQWNDRTTDNKTYRFVIKKAAITVIAKDKTAYTGGEIPFLGESDYVVEGLVNGETLKTKPTISYETAPDMKKPGTVKIVVSGAAAPDGGNYQEIVYRSGMLTISRKSSVIVVPAFHSIMVTEPENGTVELRSNYAVSNSKVTLTVTPDKGYETEAVKVVDKNGKEIPVTANGDKYTFKMPASNVTVTATFCESKDDPAACSKDHTCPMYGYTDLVRGSWYHDGVHFCLAEKMMIGTGANTFHPDAATSRAMVVTILWRLEGNPVAEDSMTFLDVEEGMWYSDAIDWASSNGIVEGYGNGKFGPEDTITREQMATILWRYAKYKGYDVSADASSVEPYSDANSISEWALSAMQWACDNQLMNGVGNGILQPAGDAARAQTATVLYRFCTNIQ